MRKFLVLFSLVLLSFSSFGQWQNLHNYFSNSIPSIRTMKFTTTNRGIAVSHYYPLFVIRTIDKGVSWDTLLVSTNYPMEFAFLDTNSFLYCCDVGILKTNDFGDTWDTIHSEIPFYTFEKLSDSVFLGISNDTLYRSADTCRTWTPLRSIVQSPYSINKKLNFINDQIGFLRYKDSVSWKCERSFDGGLSWNLVSYPPGRFQFPTPEKGFSISSCWNCPNEDSVYIYISLDTGNTWSQISQTWLNQGLSSMQFINDTIGYIGGTNQVKKTYDGGIVWYEQYQINSDYLHGMSFINNDTGFVGGMHGTLFRTFNGGDPSKIYLKSITQSINLYEGCDSVPVEFSLNAQALDTMVYVIDTMYGSAIMGADFNQIPDTISFLPGEKIKTLKLKATKDNMIEGNEEFTFVLPTLFQDTFLISIDDYAPLQLKSPFNDTSVCRGSSVALSPDIFHGVPPYFYSWSPCNSGNSCTNSVFTVAPTTGMDYFVEVQDNIGCSKLVDTVHVYVDTKLYPTIHAPIDYTAVGGTLSFTDQYPLANYFNRFWRVDYVDLPYQATLNYTFIGAGMHTVELFYETSCGAAKDVVNVNVTLTSVPEYTDENNIIVKSLSNNNFIIKSNSTIKAFVVYNSFGRQQLSLNGEFLNDNTILNLDLSQLPTGIYFLKLNFNSTSSTFKLSVQ